MAHLASRFVSKLASKPPTQPNRCTFFPLTMPRRFVKRLSRKRHALHTRWFMRPFRKMLANPAYWSVHRTNVTRAVAIALFVAFIPLPVHLLVVTVLALWLQFNIPVALATVFVSNPLTMVPQYYLCYWVGSRLLGTRLNEFAFEMSWAWVQTDLLPVWKPFLLGCLVLGAGTALVGYVLLGSLWHITLVMKYHKRKRISRAKNSANH
jgi:uncharacterized protein (DUF2062 family)